ncbi:polysaccharide biosynthesis protein [Kribbella sp. NBC_01245]|uniref:polysaccharide biosynthesis protein n=1 Tax=Kribbella sp. NBC_01245 TaxID=2903578 RepID=UPI002E2D914E|nr:polysaccharide biosynthesis protein [Kribbella sp. NBC_01245]
MPFEPTPTQAPTEPAHSLVKGAGLVGIGMAVMNVAAYGFTLVAVHALAPAQFGALTALLGLVLIGNVASLGLQATGARRIATHTGPGQAVLADSLLKAGRVGGIWLTVLALLATPVTILLLHIDSIVAVALLAPALGLMTVLGAQLGVLQGGEHWRELAIVYAMVGVGRVGLGGLGLMIEPSLVGAMGGIAAGTALPVLAAAFVLRGSTGAQPGEVRQIFHETLRGTHALAAFFVIANADVLLARALMDPDDSGRYAAGVIVAKACLFLPQFVSVVVFPALASDPDDSRRLRNAVKVVAGIGLIAIAGTLLLPDLVVAVVGGEEYAAVGPIAWLFAISGTAYAVLHLVVLAAIARQERYVAMVQWVGLAILTGSVLVILAGGFAVGTAGINALVAMTATCAVGLSVALANGIHRPVQAYPVETA